MQEIWGLRGEGVRALAAAEGLWREGYNNTAVRKDCVQDKLDSIGDDTVWQEANQVPAGWEDALVQDV